MSQGRDMLLSISDDGTSTGDPTLIENQGDLTINPGKSINTSVYKDGQNTSQNDAGQSVNLTVGLKAPLGTGQGMLMDLNDSGDVSYFWVTNAVTGGIEYEFSGRAAISTINSPVNNDNTATVQIGVVGKWTRGVKAA